MKYIDYLANMKGCPFCDHVNRAIAENETAILTYCLAPYHPDHLLIVPKRHEIHLLDLTDSEIKDIDQLEKQGLSMLKRLGYESISLLVREGDHVGKSIKHLHYHLIPNIALGNATHSGGDRKVLTEDEISKLLSRFQAVA